MLDSWEVPSCIGLDCSRLEGCDLRIALTASVFLVKVARAAELESHLAILSAPPL